MPAQIPSTMKQWITDYSGLDTLTQEEAVVPKPGPGEVLVKISAVSLNFRDVEVCMGDYDHHDSLPLPPKVVPCSDFVGTIVAFGPQDETNGESSFREGDRVMAIFNLTHLTGQITDEHLPSGLGLPLPGVLREYATFPLYSLVKAPGNLSDAMGSTLPIAAATAWMAINWMQPIGRPLQGPEHIVLLQGTGGVSTAGLQMAHALGLKSE
jgi:NADPH:quinone reductase-like Zn-dependent oxidoreductase